jgi:autophagy-related protein 27
MDAKWELKNSKSNDDSTKEGLRLEMNGGFKKADNGKSRSQKAIVEFLCDKSRTGLENLPKPEDPYEDVKDKREEEGDEKEEDDGTPSLEFMQYDTDGKDSDILRLQWRTKYACEDAIPVVEHWGFFTWFLIMYVFWLSPSLNYSAAY